MSKVRLKAATDGQAKNEEVGLDGPVGQEVPGRRGQEGWQAQHLGSWQPHKKMGHAHHVLERKSAKDTEQALMI